MRARYRIRLQPHSPGGFKKTERIEERLLEHFRKKIGQTGPWDTIIWDTNFYRGFTKLITTVPPTTSTTTLQTAEITTTKGEEIVDTSTTTMKTTYIGVTSDLSSSPASDVVTKSTEPSAEDSTTKQPLSTAESSTESALTSKDVSTAKEEIKMSSTGIISTESTNITSIANQTVVTAAPTEVNVTSKDLTTEKAVLSTKPIKEMTELIPEITDVTSTFPYDYNTSGTPFYTYIFSESTSSTDIPRKEITTVKELVTEKKSTLEEITTVAAFPDDRSSTTEKDMKTEVFATVEPEANTTVTLTTTQEMRVGISDTVKPLVNITATDTTKITTALYTPSSKVQTNATQYETDGIVSKIATMPTVTSQYSHTVKLDDENAAVSNIALPEPTITVKETQTETRFTEPLSTTKLPRTIGLETKLARILPKSATIDITTMAATTGVHITESVKTEPDTTTPTILSPVTTAEETVTETVTKVVTSVQTTEAEIVSEAAVQTTKDIKVTTLANVSEAESTTVEQYTPDVATKPTSMPQLTTVSDEIHIADISVTDAANRTTLQETTIKPPIDETITLTKIPETNATTEKDIFIQTKWHRELSTATAETQTLTEIPVVDELTQTPSKLQTTASTLEILKSDTTVANVVDESKDMTTIHTIPIHTDSVSTRIVGEPSVVTEPTSPEPFPTTDYTIVPSDIYTDITYFNDTDEMMLGERTTDAIVDLKTTEAISIVSPQIAPELTNDTLFEGTPSDKEGLFSLSTPQTVVVMEKQPLISDVISIRNDSFTDVEVNLINLTIGPEKVIAGTNKTTQGYEKTTTSVSKAALEEDTEPPSAEITLTASITHTESQRVDKFNTTGAPKITITQESSAIPDILEETSPKFAEVTQRIELETSNVTHSEPTLETKRVSEAQPATTVKVDSTVLQMFHTKVTPTFHDYVTNRTTSQIITQSIFERPTSAFAEIDITKEAISKETPIKFESLQTTDTTGTLVITEPTTTAVATEYVTHATDLTTGVVPETLPTEKTKTAGEVVTETADLITEVAHKVTHAEQTELIPEVVTKTIDLITEVINGTSPVEKVKTATEAVTKVTDLITEAVHKVSDSVSESTYQTTKSTSQSTGILSEPSATPINATMGITKMPKIKEETEATSIPSRMTNDTFATNDSLTSELIQDDETLEILKKNISLENETLLFPLSETADLNTTDIHFTAPPVTTNEQQSAQTKIASSTTVLAVAKAETSKSVEETHVLKTTAVVTDLQGQTVTETVISQDEVATPATRLEQEQSSPIRKKLITAQHTQAVDIQAIYTNTTAVDTDRTTHRMTETTTPLPFTEADGVTKAEFRSTVTATETKSSEEVTTVGMPTSQKNVTQTSEPDLSTSLTFANTTYFNYSDTDITSSATIPSNETSVTTLAPLAEQNITVKEQAQGSQDILTEVSNITRATDLKSTTILESQVTTQKEEIITERSVTLIATATHPNNITTEYTLETKAENQTGPATTIVAQSTPQITDILSETTATPVNISVGKTSRTTGTMRANTATTVADATKGIVTEAVLLPETSANISANVNMSAADGVDTVLFSTNTATETDATVAWTDNRAVSVEPEITGVAETDTAMPPVGTDLVNETEIPHRKTTDSLEVSGNETTTTHNETTMVSVSKAIEDKTTTTHDKTTVVPVSKEGTDTTTTHNETVVIPITKVREDNETVIQSRNETVTEIPVRREDKVNRTMAESSHANETATQSFKFTTSTNNGTSTNGHDATTLSYLYENGTGTSVYNETVTYDYNETATYAYNETATYADFNETATYAYNETATYAYNETATYPYDETATYAYNETATYPYYETATNSYNETATNSYDETATNSYNETST